MVRLGFDKAPALDAKQISISTCNREITLCMGPCLASSKSASPRRTAGTSPACSRAGRVAGRGAGSIVVEKLV